MVNHRAARIRGQLKKELESFEDLDHELLPSQEKRFRDLVALMGQSAAGSSKASRRRRMRASKVLHAIGSNLGAEVLYLCTQSLSLTCLSELDEMDVVTMLSPWWSAKQCPLRLRRVAAHLWSTYKLDTYIQRNLGTEGGQVTRNHFDRVLQDISESVIENPAEIIEGGLSAENVSHSQTIGSLAGKVFELTLTDLQSVATSDQIQGQILLTDPYEHNYSSFITIPISKELRSYFVAQRVQVFNC